VACRATRGFSNQELIDLEGDNPDGAVSFPVISFSTSRLKSSFGKTRALRNQVAQSKRWPSSTRMSNQG
jgi:hypothetical protein